MSYNRPLSHQEYLQKKYLSQNDYDVPKKKKKTKNDSDIKKIKAPTVRIVDDDLDIKKLKRRDSDDEDIYFGTKEEKPEIASVIDDRPLANRNEKETKGKWKRICEDDEEPIVNEDIEKASSSKKDKKSEKMSSGARAGLSNLKDLKDEARQLKKRQDKLMKGLADDLSGRNAKTVFRDRSTGKIRDIEKELEAKESELAEKAARDAEKKAVYDRWNKGLVQNQARKEQLESDLYEMSKPMARDKDDEDLDAYLKDQERDDDPMLQQMRKKKLEERKAADPNFKVYPKYKGPPAPLNRFKIQPGYRWDGVNRSNGYEARYFQQINSKIALEEEAYKWSTEDM